jgi:signal transduction histidine kinase
MRRHAEEVFAVRDIELQFDVPESDSGLKLGVGVRRDLLLIFKEAVNNIARHSDCSKVNIGLKTDNSNLFLEISDNGHGFAERAADGGQGIRSMRRRATAMGGELMLNSDRDHGTTVEFVLPLVKADRT